MAFLAYLHRAVARENLSAAEARQAMLAILEGEATTAQIAAFLAALRTKGETAEELRGFALAMREKAARVEHGITGEPILDTCGTGGDGGRTFNVSTAVAFVVAGAGVRVAKHGNRSLSSRCGSADVLEALGVNISMTPQQASLALRQVGICFLFAPAMHPAIRYAQPARAELKIRTVFNLLGPLANPAGATVQLIGAPSTAAAELMAEALLGLDVEAALLVHGHDGLDEITLTGPTCAWEIMGSRLRRLTLEPADFGLGEAPLQAIAGEDPASNAAILKAVLHGESGPRRDVVLANAAAALVIAGRARSWREGVALAADAIDSGQAWRKLEQLAAFPSAL